jgi:hypothetical protein
VVVSLYFFSVSDAFVILGNPRFELLFNHLEEDRSIAVVAEIESGGVTSLASADVDDSNDDKA